MVGFSMNNIIRSEGNAKIAMYSMLLSAGTNVILNPVFIFVLGWGVRGSAVATVISMIFLDIWVIAHFRSSRSVIKLRKEFIKIDFSILRDIVAIGISPFAMQVAGSFIQGVFNKKLIIYGGDLAVGAMGIINSISFLVVMTIIAINMASQPIIGYNYGARMMDRVKEALKKALTGATAVAVVSFALIEIFAGDLVGMFNTSSPELTNIAVPGLKVYLLALPVVGYQIITGNYFQSVGKAKTAILLTLLRQVLVLLPLLYILPAHFGLKGIWLASPVSDSVSALIVATFLIREWRKMGHF
jgi:putative MATE family efflux protein